VTGAFDAFRWRVPLQAADGGALLVAKMEELIGLGAGKEPALAHADAAGAAQAARSAPGIAARPEATAATAAAIAPTRGLLPVAIGAEPAVAPARGAAHAETQAAAGKDSAAVAASAQRPEAERRSGIRPRPTEPKIFVSPRAPDDPGPDGSGDELKLGALRASGAKA
jgi:HemY protein